MAEYFFELLTEEIPAWMHGSFTTPVEAALQTLVTELGGGVEADQAVRGFVVVHRQQRDADPAGLRRGDARLVLAHGWPPWSQPGKGLSAACDRNLRWAESTSQPVTESDLRPHPANRKE